MFLKNKSNTDYTDQTKLFFTGMKNKFGISARISDIWGLLTAAFGVTEFILLEPKFYMNAEFESKLINYFLDWNDGKDIDFSEIADLILDTGDFTSSEKLMFFNNTLEECLWAMFILISGKEEI